MILLGCPLPHKKGHVVFLSTDIGGAITNSTNADYTDVYSDTFPQGVTIAVPVDDFYKLWQIAVNIDEPGDIELDDDKSDYFH